LLAARHLEAEVSEVERGDEIADKASGVVWRKPVLKARREEVGALEVWLPEAFHGPRQA
jgi:hypothetical protein